jgi:hypothetical protein
MVGVHRVITHANQDTQASIEVYHGAIKWWLKHDIGGTKAQRVHCLVWRLTNLVSRLSPCSRGKKKGNYTKLKCQKDCGRWHIAT